MRAMIVKEYRELLRDHRTLVLMVGLPLLLLVVFGYAARFDVSSVDAAVVGPRAEQAAESVPEFFTVIDVDADADSDDARTLLRNNKATVALDTSRMPPTLLIDGSDLFAAQAAKANVAAVGAGGGPQINTEVLFNPDLSTTTVMVPSLIGFIMLFVGVVITSLGVVREREQGTLEQLAVMPLRPADVMAGKIVPYFLIALVDIAMVTAAGLLIFDVPFNGSVPMFVAYVFVFLFVVLGLGVAISTVSQNQGQAIQLAIMVLLPQIMLSGMIFPLESMASWIRTIGYALPLTWFVKGMRGIFLRGSDPSVLVGPLAVLGVMAVVVFGVAMFRFRQELAPKQSADGLAAGTGQEVRS